ncbi:nuclear transport factor 2 family protein [Sphingobium aromaticiconvertens]|uniref:nuclear transport factor 2 family protein n=1 Tax=Sphingobium aromaticiconvertens TaxID=365341 RepID=UPI003016C283
MNDEGAVSDEERANTLLRHVLDGFNAGDIDAIADCFHPEVRAEFPFAPPAMPTLSHGHAAVMAAFREGRASLEEIKITPAKIYWCAGDSTLLLEASSKGRLRGGGDYRNSYVFVIGIRDERIILWREYFDSLAILKAFDTMSAGAAS